MKFKNEIGKILWLIAGIFFMILGFLGIFLPILPVIPLWIIASSCFFRGSKRVNNAFEKYVLKNRYFEKYFKKHMTEKNILWLKLGLVAFSWVSASFSFFFILNTFLLRLGLILVVLATTIYILSIKPLKE